jgi:hypothetical protein
MENLKYIFNQVNDWIKIADQKALILGSFNIAAFIYQLINFDKLNNASCSTIILFILSVLLTIFGLIIWLRIIYPKLGNQKISKIYFLHIANAYGDKISKGTEEMTHINEKEFKEDLANQIISNSVVAKSKYSNIQIFIWVYGFQLCILILFFISTL